MLVDDSDVHRKQHTHSSRVYLIFVWNYLSFSISCLMKHICISYFSNISILDCILHMKIQPGLDWHHSVTYCKVANLSDWYLDTVLNAEHLTECFEMITNSTMRMDDYTYYGVDSSKLLASSLCVDWQILVRNFREWNWFVHLHSKR